MKRQKHLCGAAVRLSNDKLVKRKKATESCNKAAYSASMK